MDVAVAGLQKILTFVVIFAVLVFFHELGHFWLAKLFRMRVDEFALGFGPRLLRVGFDGQTEYNIRAVPLGGFVRIAGMDIEDAAERRLTGTAPAAAPKEHAENSTETTNAVLMQQEAAEVDQADPNGFNSRPIYQRFLVILAGPVFSVFLGWLAFCSIGAIYGERGPVTTRIAAVTAGDVAERAGLKVGDTVVAIDGKPLEDGISMVMAIRGSAGKPLRFTLQDQAGARREVTVTPRTEREGGASVGKIGISPYAPPLRRVGLARSFALGNEQLTEWLQQFAAIFSSARRVKDSLGGPIAIFQATGQAVDAGGPVPLLLLANLSLSIGLFNLLPIPMLDGGHLALLTLEGVRGRKLTAEQTQRVLVTGLAIIAFLFVWVMFNDITRLFRPG